MAEGNGKVGEMRWEPIIQELAEKIEKESWTVMFNEAIKSAQSYGIPEMKDITSLSKYLDYINHFLFWVPQESFQGKDIYYRLCMFYFLLDQSTIKQLQTPIKREYAESELSWLSNWLVRYTQDMGKFLDRPESLTEDSLRTFKDSPSYLRDEYLEPHGGWRTYNELFAWNFELG